MSFCAAISTASEIAIPRLPVLFGSFLSIVFPFLGKKFRDKKEVRVIACEPKSCPSLTKGKYVYDFGDTGNLTPLVKMHTLGSSFMPPATHSGGLRYHGMAPMVSHLKEIGAIEAKAFGQKECFESGVKFANVEGIIPAPEATHAVKGAIDAALECKKNGKSKTILFNLCGHGHFDMQAYGDYFDNKLAEDTYNEAAVNKALENLPKIA